MQMHLYRCMCADVCVHMQMLHMLKSEYRALRKP